MCKVLFCKLFFVFILILLSFNAHLPGQQGNISGVSNGWRRQDYNVPMYYTLWGLLLLLQLQYNEDNPASIDISTPLRFVSLVVLHASNDGSVCPGSKIAANPPSHTDWMRIITDLMLPSTATKHVKIT